MKERAVGGAQCTLHPSRSQICHTDDQLEDEALHGLPEGLVEVATEKSLQDAEDMTGALDALYQRARVKANYLSNAQFDR